MGYKFPWFSPSIFSLNPRHTRIPKECMARGFSWVLSLFPNGGKPCSGTENKTYRCVGICLLKPLFWSYRHLHFIYSYIFIVETWKLISYMRHAIALDSSLQHKIRVAMAVNKTEMSLAHLTQFNISRAGCLTLPEKFLSNKATDVRI